MGDLNNDQFDDVVIVRKQPYYLADYLCRKCISLPVPRLRKKQSVLQRKKA